jgi:hypothetical protein
VVYVIKSIKLGPGEVLIETHYEGPIHGVWDASGGYARVTVVA